GGLQLEGAQRLGLDRALAVERVAQRVDHAAEERVAHRHREHLTGAADGLALLDALEVTEDDDTDLAHVEVERDTARAVLELQQLVRHRRGQAGDMGDAVAAVDDGPDLLAGRAFRLVGLDEALKRVPDLVRPDRQLRHLDSVSLFIAAPLSLAGQPAADFFDTSQDGGVDDLVSDPDREATDHLRIHLAVEADVATV